jgi:hypothetical protein
MEQLIAAGSLQNGPAGVKPMRTKLMTAAFAAAAAMTLNAQAPQSAPPTPQTAPPRPSPTAPADAQKAQPANQTITITGCLKEGKDVPGLKATEDLVLTEVKMSPSSSVSGIGVATRYQVTGLAEAELKKHANHQVELTGTAAPAGPGAAPDSAPDFKATAIKMVAATCGAK